jgi:hypothetical protein
MRDGESVVVRCVDGYDLDSQMHTAYNLQKLENCKFRCSTNGLELTVIKGDVQPILDNQKMAKRDYRYAAVE